MHDDQKLIEGLVIATTRRSARVLIGESEISTARISNAVKDVVVGDRVLLKEDQGNLLMTGVEERKNCLSRVYRQRARSIAANLDHVFVVTAVVPLFNTHFVDRVLAVCKLQQIPCSLILNKCDLDVSATRALCGVYEKLNVPILHTSAKRAIGMDELRAFLCNPHMSIAALSGISGVGKSSLLNVLVPEAKQRTVQVSRKTGQGRQTTSQAVGHNFQRPSGADLLLIDLPGIHSFGISDLTPHLASHGFAEFLKFSCEYTDCRHTAEPNCAIKKAVESGEVAETRYSSYIAMLAEIEAERRY